MHFKRLPRSMPIKIRALIRNASHCRSIPLNSSQSGIWHWSALIWIERNWSSLGSVPVPECWSALGIDRGSPDFKSLKSLGSIDQCLIWSCGHVDVFKNPVHVLLLFEAWTWMLTISRVLTTCQPLPESLNLLLIEEYDYQSHSSVVFKMVFG